MNRVSQFFQNIDHIFWDLDHTLWDYSTNSRLTIFELYEKYELHTRFEHGPDVFHRVYSKHNDLAWEDYRDGRIDKTILRQRRFRDTFIELGTAPEGLSEIFETEFVELCRIKPHLVEGALEVLSFFSTRFQQHIITNGFKEALDFKIKSSAIEHFFESITNSEDSGIQKPNPGIFKLAMDKAGAINSNSLMIGDNYQADILGAFNAGMKCIYYNPENNTETEIQGSIISIRDLRELVW